MKNPVVNSLYPSLKALAEVDVINSLIVDVIKRKRKIFEVSNAAATLMMEHDLVEREAMHFAIWQLEGTGPLYPFLSTKIVLPKHRRN